MMKGGFGMNIFKYFVVSSLLLLQTSLCFAGSKNVINFSVAPDPFTHCHQYGVDVAITENSTLGVLPASCTDRPTFGVINSQVTSTFNRTLIVWRYSPYGAFQDGYFVDAMVGAETNEFKSAAGSAANVSFIDAGGHVGYQWFWHNGFNVSALTGVGHLMRNSLDTSISPAESRTVSDYLDRQTSTTTHAGWGVNFGWAF